MGSAEEHRRIASEFTATVAGTVPTAGSAGADVQTKVLAFIGRTP